MTLEEVCLPADGLGPHGEAAEKQTIGHQWNLTHNLLSDEGVITERRSKPIVHSPVDPPVCDACQQLDLVFFNPLCDGCQTILIDSHTTIPQILAILRQWTPQTQQSLEILIREVGILNTNQS